MTHSNGPKHRRDAAKLARFIRVVGNKMRYARKGHGLANTWREDKHGELVMLNRARTVDLNAG